MSVPLAEEMSLRDLAIRIWKAGVNAVDAERLVRKCITVDGPSRVLTICGHPLSLDRMGRICVVGAGKAGAGMAAGVEAALGDAIVQERVDGWVNVPENCVRPLTKIHLHPARPAGVNEPTEAGVAGTEEILKRVSALQPNDLCLVLISGGGSALLPAPVPGVTLAEKLALTRFLSQSGATIHELNAVRKAISRIKGGGLARACRAGTLIALVISDVISDPLPVIASGPTVNEPLNPAEVLAVLKKFDPDRSRIAASIWNHIESLEPQPRHSVKPTTAFFNHIIGNNRIAVEAAAAEARSLGADYVRILAVDQPGVASEIGVELAQECIDLTHHRTRRGLTCIVSGGEPVVRLSSTEKPRKGGRNQELALSALCKLWNEFQFLAKVASWLRVTRGESSRDSIEAMHELFAAVQAAAAKQREDELPDLVSGLSVLGNKIDFTQSAVIRAMFFLGQTDVDEIVAGMNVPNRFGEIAPQVVLLSGGTDGEDGPTDAAGAFVDLGVLQKAEELGLDPADFLAINNSYEFFEKTGGLLITGPTHTNVMDLRVALVRT
jgi:glycerate 2-kinase